VIKSNLSSFFFTFTFGGFDSDFFVIFFKSSQIFSGFGEFTFFHTFTDVPVNESSFGVHKIEFVIESGENFSNSSGVGDHANSSHDFSEITTGNNGGGLVVDTNFESSGAPINELDGSLGFDGSDSSINIFGDNISSVHHGASHIFTVSGITFGHHVGGFERTVGDFSNGELFVVSFFSRDDGSETAQHKVNSGVGNQIGLEFSNIDVKGTIESEGSSQTGDNLSDQSVQVSVGGSFDIEVSSADIVDSFVIEHNGNIGMFEERVGTQDRVVGFNDGS